MPRHHSIYLHEPVQSLVISVCGIESQPHKKFPFGSALNYGHRLRVQQKVCAWKLSVTNNVVLGLDKVKLINGERRTSEMSFKPLGSH